MARKTNEIRVRVRSGSAGDGHGGYRKVRVVYVAPHMIWIGEEERKGIAWISGKQAIRDLRDALSAVLRQSDR